MHKTILQSTCDLASWHLSSVFVQTVIKILHMFGHFLCRQHIGSTWWLWHCTKRERERKFKDADTALLNQDAVSLLQTYSSSKHVLHAHLVLDTVTESGNDMWHKGCSHSAGHGWRRCREQTGKQIKKMISHGAKCSWRIFQAGGSYEEVHLNWDPNDKKEPVQGRARTRAL